MNPRPLAAALLALALAGCRDDLATIEIFAICAPPDDAAACGTSGSCEAVLASPRLDVLTSVNVGGVATVNQLEAFVQLNNQLPDNADVDLGRVNTNDFIGEAYLIHFRGVAGLSDVVYPANFTVAAESSSTPVIPIIPQSTMIQLRGAMADDTTALVVAEVRVRGHLIDGSEIETESFDVAVNVTDSGFIPAGCPTAGDVRFYCPNAGQTASTVCEAP
jgi:hypothetical protein